MPELAHLIQELKKREHPFYLPKIQQAEQGGWQWEKLAFTTKEELLAQQSLDPPYGKIWTYPLDRYTRFHQTSGTKGTPLRWLDTPENWQWAVGCWRKIYEIANVTVKDRILFPFSFGPFLGFWTAFEAASQLGCLAIATGGMSTTARIKMIVDHQATVLCCTPTYALHLAQMAKELGVDLAKTSAVRMIIVAGEPGGSIPATRRQIETSWNARVIDHSGMTEVGPMAVECWEHPGGLHVLEDDFFIEVLDPANHLPVPAGEIGELVVTNLGRWGSPVLRYRTGDLVRVDPKPCPCGRSFRRLEGGILGRTDDMISIRGNNFYPSALEGVLRRFSEVIEYRVEVDTSSPLAELKIEVELADGASKEWASTLAQTIRDELLFRAEIVLAPAGSLPRYEMKANRVRKR